MQHPFPTLQQQIDAKQRSTPVLAEGAWIRAAETDITSWPYPRMFRGERASDEPVVWGRTAGYRALWSTPESAAPFRPWRADLCYQNACSTVLPCGGGGKREAPSEKNAGASFFEETPHHGCVYISP